jgi:hypothetical protein
METQKNYWGLRVGNFLAFIGTIIVNALAVLLPLNNKNTGELSDNIPNLFVPAGLTFSVWGVIYVFLALFGFYQLSNAWRNDSNRENIIEQIGPFFILAGIFNITWIFLWHYELVNLSLIAMLGLLGSLLAIYVRLKIGKIETNSRDKIFVHTTISIYLGWISVATIANVTAVAVVNNWDGFGIIEELWTILILIIVIIIGSAMLILRKDVAYNLVILWALGGIYLKRIDPLNSPQPGIVITTIIGLILISVEILYVLIKSRK